MHPSALKIKRSRQVKQRGYGGNRDGTRQNEMGKPVRRTFQPGLQPPVMAWRPKTGLRIREATLVSDAHTATPDTRPYALETSRERLRKCFEKANEV